MTSHELNRTFQLLLDATTPERALTRYLFVVARGFDSISSELMGVLQARNRTLFASRQGTAQEKMADLRRQSEQFPLGQIFHDLTELQKALTTIIERFDGAEVPFFQEMEKRASSFHDAFERLVRSPSGESFAAMLPEALQIYTHIISARQLLSTIRNVLQQGGQPRPDEGHLSIVFTGAPDYGGLVRKLAALETGYGIICGLAGLAPNAYPLRVLKIEAPRLWISVVGERTAMMVLRGVVERFCAFWYHRPVPMSRSEAHADRVTATQSLINLADELQRAGVSTVAADASEIREPALTLRSVLIDLIDGESSLKVNDRLFSRTAGSEDERARLPLPNGGSAMPMLHSSTEAPTSLVELLRANVKRASMLEA